MRPDTFRPALAFEPNRGQAGAGADARLLARAPGYTVALADRAVHFYMRDSRLTLSFVGARPTTPEPMAPLPGRSHYFLGRDPAGWRTNVPHFARVRYSNLYPGTDLVLYGNPGQLEYDFTLAPGADPSRIVFACDGVRSVSLTRQGDLLLETGSGNLRQHRPRAYQVHNGTRRPVAASFRLLGSNRIGFSVPRYDKSRPLVIDPVLSWATYLGGPGLDAATAIALDRSGNIYVAGESDAAGYPSTSPLSSPSRGRDAVLTKLNPSGTAALYSLYLGGSALDSAFGLAVDSAGNAYLTGFTTSSDFPVASAFQSSLSGTQDAFLAKINPAGDALVFSTYYGGRTLEAGRSVFVDASGNILVTGFTTSADFPTHSPFQSVFGGVRDAFAVKFAPTGASTVFSTYLGGSGEEDAASIASDATGNVYFTGFTRSANFPTRSAIQPAKGDPSLTDGFLAKLSPAGEIGYSTFLGGSDEDLPRALAVDSDGNVFVAGDTKSPNFPTREAAQGSLGSPAEVDAFLTKVNPSGSALVFSTFLGGALADRAFGVAVDAVGNSYLAGDTRSRPFPTVDAIDAPRYNPQGPFLAKYTPAGRVTYSIFFGAGAGTKIALDAFGNAYLAFNIANPNNLALTTVGVFQPRYGGGAGDMAVVKIGDSAQPAGGTLACVSGASFTAAGVAAESIVAAFGPSVAPLVDVATSAQLPTDLSGVTVKVTDSAGTARLAKLFFISPTQVNFVLPAGTATGIATVSVERDGQVLSSGQVTVRRTAPGIFTANSDGRGAPRALLLRVRADGSQSTEPVFQCGTAPGSCAAAMIDPGPDSDQLILLLFGTGFRGASSVTATAGGLNQEVLGFAPQGEYEGLDQINLRLARALTNRGPVSLLLTADGIAANAVTLAFPGGPLPTLGSVAPNAADQGQTIATLTLTGANLESVTSLEFSTAAGITVSNVRATATSVTARVVIAADAPAGIRTITAVSSTARSNPVDFTVRAVTPPPPADPYLPLATGYTWTYRVTFPGAVELPYLPTSETPGVTCAPAACATSSGGPAAREIRLIVGNRLPNGAFALAMNNAAKDFLFGYFGSDDEIRLRAAGSAQNLDIVAPLGSDRFYRTMARLTSDDLARPKETVTVPAGTYSDVVRTSVVLTGDGVNVSGTFTTDVWLAPNVGIVRAVMRNAAGATLYTQELTGFFTSPPNFPPAISSIRPTSAARGQTVTDFTIGGEDLAGVTAIEFNPPAGITVSRLTVTGDTLVGAQIAIDADAAVGRRTVTVVNRNGRSNALNFDITDPPTLTILNLTLGPASNSGGDALLPFKVDFSLPGRGITRQDRLATLVSCGGTVFLNNNVTNPFFSTVTSGTLQQTLRFTGSRFTSPMFNCSFRLDINFDEVRSNILTAPVRLQ